jgi:hypothetical protein
MRMQGLGSSHQKNHSGFFWESQQQQMLAWLHQLKGSDGCGVKAQDAPPVTSQLAVTYASGFVPRDIQHDSGVYIYHENNQTHPNLLYTCLPSKKIIPTCCHHLFTMNGRTMHGYWWYTGRSAMQQGRSRSQTLSADLLVAA